MEHSVLTDNQRKRIEVPLRLLFCFALFMTWQMGVIYFAGPTLSLDGRTPLPVSGDNLTLLIALGYLFSIAWLLLLPRFIVYAERVSAAVALLSVLALYGPFSPGVLEYLIYIQIFCCCFMIGFENAVIVYLFREKTAILHLLLAYGVGLLLVAVLQNDFARITFPQFHLCTVIMLGLMLVFFFWLPSKTWPQYARRGDDLVCPKRFFRGTYIVMFLTCLLAVASPAVAEETPHGVFIAYLSAALCCLFSFFLWKWRGIHPLSVVPTLIGLSAVGFALLLAAPYAPALSLLSCFCLGAGLVPCNLLPLFGIAMASQYPSRYISAATIGFGLLAVLIHSALIEAFRHSLQLLHIIYLVLVVALVVLYLLLEPYLFQAFRRRGESPSEEGAAEDSPRHGSPASPGEEKERLPDLLTRREREVAELLVQGHTNADIAKILIISEHTVKDHVKSIYRKLNVHSRFELSARTDRGMALRKD
ncbi:MAG: helix-turn-helix transcriptional regulator [Bacillota bacterium]|nr:helix-turn-helix transcriptional regulator [Bacillota bacterium]